MRLLEARLIIATPARMDAVGSLELQGAAGGCRNSPAYREAGSEDIGISL